MFWSKSSFFKQPQNVLNDKFNHVIALFGHKGFREDQYSLFLTAYRYFIDHPSQFDGATIVKDLYDIKGLDLSAMKHDYIYLTTLPKFKGLEWLRIKIKYDWQYGRDMELLGKGITTPYARAIGLILSTPIYWVMTKIKIE